MCLVYFKNTRQKHVFGWVLDELVIRFEVATTSIDVRQNSLLGLCSRVAGFGVPDVMEHFIFIILIKFYLMLFKL